MYVLMLRGINVGGRHKVPMAELRALLTEAGYGEVRTYVQSGNVVLDGGGASAAELEERVAALVETRFAFAVPVIARTRDELAAVVALDPLAAVVTDPRRYQVTFLAAPPDPGVMDRLQGTAAGGERVVAHGREIYAWHPDGIARSKLGNAMAGPRLGGTARNWTTVTTLLSLADS